MYTWIIYDITDNRQRTKVADRCRQLGLQRVQRSVFLGKVRKRLLSDFQREAPGLINFKTDRLFIVPMSRKQYEEMARLGKAVPRLAARGDTLFF